MKKIQNFAALNGVMEQTGSGFSYVPMLVDPDRPENGFQFCTVKSDHDFSGGEISFKVKLENTGTTVQLILNWGTFPIYVCFNDEHFAYSFKSYQSQTNQLVPLTQAGSKSNIKAGTEYTVKVSFKSSILRYYVNNVEMLAWNQTLNRAPISFNVFGPSAATITDVLVKDDKPKAFVVMQFTEQFNELYENVIKPVCESVGLEPIRADDMYTNGLIIFDIIQSIQHASVIISDITPDNPNVYYEVGYAHAAGKHVILMCDKERERLPFDVSGFRTIFYSNSISGKSVVEERLTKHLASLYIS
ncbi:hypothetical protein J0J26_24155 [Vibrio vulnificus]|uniref:hypothetical protein n=1 Tax=Vibrio vulnificus TaxID=672 RepID=UPI0019D4C95E|nr:hypothetical protein [Vibrio vulnificus]MBN8091006.1 hypothetical protein [Vibrio vulnificus]MBN8119977.1 hypothetical protein [Vibrio vulnificus]